MSESKSKLSGQSGDPSDVGALKSALQFEQEKNEVLLNEVVTLEDELVNRQIQEFEGVFSSESAGFWKEQLLANREEAVVALRELKQAKEHASPGGKQPLHNRQRSRPAPRRGLVGEGGAHERNEDSLAVRIRNRAQTLSREEKIPFSTAFRQAEKEFCGEVQS